MSNLGFHVVNIRTGVPVENVRGVPRVFTDGKEATEWAKYMTSNYGVKHQPRPIIDQSVDWHAREEKKFADGIYQRLHWDLYHNSQDRHHVEARQYYWFYSSRKPEALYHFPHVSKNKPGCISFTESDEKGRADRQASGMLPGRYIKAFYNGLSDDQIRHLANEFLAMHGNVELCFARTQDDIEQVYRTGPESCMSHPLCSYSSIVHPTRVYGLDITVAYLHVKDLPKEERAITARCIVWEEKKIYGRTYGDEGKLHALLEDQGFRFDEGEDGFDGARLHKIKSRSNFVMPYLDNDYGVEDNGEHFVMVPSKPGCAQTNGLLGDGCVCPRCEEYHNTNQFRYVRDREEGWCSDCCEYYTWQCDATGNVYSEDVEAVRMFGGNLWHPDFFEDHGFVCGYDGNNYSNSHAIEMANGERWARRNFLRHGSVCACGKNVPNNYQCDCEASQAMEAAE